MTQNQKPLQCVWAQSTQKIVDGKPIKMPPPQCRRKRCNGFFTAAQPKCDRFVEKVGE